MKKLLSLIILILIVIGSLTYVYFNPNYYSSEDFNIETLQSSSDKDGDGIEDLQDIVINARAYVKKRPKYKSNYYAKGYPDDQYGVCTDVIAQALLNSGYDLQALVNTDRSLHPNLYEVEVIDPNIDFRRVRNLDIYFKNNWTSLTLDLKDISSWQPGDIVTTKKHIGVLSDKRNKKGIPFVIHHASKGQLRYEEDVLENFNLIGHYRVIEP